MILRQHFTLRCPRPSRPFRLHPQPYVLSPFVDTAILKQDPLYALGASCVEKSVPGQNDHKNIQKTVKERCIAISMLPGDRQIG